MEPESKKETAETSAGINFVYDNEKARSIGVTFFKAQNYISSIVRAFFYTPVIISFAFFAVILTTTMPESLQQYITKLVFIFFPDGQLENSDFLSIYGTLAFGVSLVISITEALLNKKFTVNPKKKMLALLLILLVGYASTFIFFIKKTSSAKITLTTLTVFLAFFAVSSFTVFMDYRWSKREKFLEELFVNNPVVK